jgi:hypothetical protein
MHRRDVLPGGCDRIAAPNDGTATINNQQDIRDQALSAPVDCAAPADRSLSETD